MLDLPTIGSEITKPKSNRKSHAAKLKPPQTDEKKVAKLKIKSPS